MTACGAEVVKDRVVVGRDQQFRGGNPGKNRLYPPDMGVPHVRDV